MEVKQIYNTLNIIVKEVLGEQAIVNEDLSNLVDVGTDIFNANAVDNYVRTLCDVIGKMIFVNRPYMGSAPKVLMDAWEFGSVLEKIQMDMPQAEENESWELQDNTVYEQDMFYKPTITVTFFNSKTTFEVPMSITEKQVKESFNNAQQMNAFIEMIYSTIDKSMTVKTDALVMRTINNMIALTLNADYPSATYTTSSGVKAINLLKLYNDKFSTSLNVNEVLTSPDFIRFATYTMSLYIDRIGKISTLFNIKGKERFTPTQYLHFILLNDFAKASSIYLQSDTYHKELITLPNYETVPYWQGSGTSYAFNDISSINIKANTGSGAVNVNASGILGIMFDRDALGVTNFDKRVTNHYNGKAEFWNYWFKQDASYFNDMSENAIVFFVA